MKVHGPSQKNKAFMPISEAISIVEHIWLMEFPANR